MPAYSKTDKFLHRLYLSNYPVARSSMELDSMMFGKKAKEIELESVVFVTGLARSGTTAVMRKLYDTGQFASLQYSNMPFLLCPNLWNRSTNIEKHERAHKDGIFVDGNSPEALDEFFWKACLDDKYIEENELLPNEINKDILKQYVGYIKLICHSKGRTRYLSKNNNSILRLPAIAKIPNHKIIVLYRDPLSHASSLLKLHRKFSAMQSEDPFILEYFDFLGHHEFGLHHKPFLLTEEFNNTRKNYDPLRLNYWLAIWLNYYSYVLKVYNNSYYFICFEDLINNRRDIYSQLSGFLNIEIPINNTPGHLPTKYDLPPFDQVLFDQCNIIYEKLHNVKIF